MKRNAARAFGATPVNRTYNLDCLAGMRLLPESYVDLVLSDLPYGRTLNGWDTVLDLPRFWAEVSRIIRPRTAVVLTAQCPFDKLLGMSNPEWLRYEWIWEKSKATGFFNAKRVPMKAHENILVFYQQLPTYNPQFAAGEPYVNSPKNYFSRNLGRHVSCDAITNSGYRYPRSVLRFPSEGRVIHPTQKPVALFEYLIRTYTNPGDLVLDPCIGSGTTAVACVRTGRNYIGFELDRSYCSVAARRVRQAHQAFNTTL